jgi:hypothetical protein
MIAWVSLAFAATDPCAEAPEVLAERSAAFKKLYDDSEAERADRSRDAESVLKRDEERVAEILKADKKGELCTADDKWYAAWVLEQSDDLDTLERAYELAIASMEAHHANGAWLVGFAFDRKRTAAGFPQAYGTQTRVDANNKRCLIEVDPATTDEQRAKYGHKPIAEMYRKVLDLNGYTSDEATLERLNRRSLYCPPEAITRKGLKNQERMDRARFE